MLTFSFFYNAPLFALGLIWLLLRARENKKWSVFRKLLDILVIGIAFSRFMGAAIPPSGHALFLTHSLLTVNNWFYRISAAIMLIATVALKVGWKDCTSWAYGMGFGVTSGIIWIYTFKPSAQLKTVNSETEKGT